MFETNDRGRLPHSIFCDAATHRWAYIAQSSNDEWFYVTHQYRTDEGSSDFCKQQFMIPIVPYLMGLVSTNCKDDYVSEIQLVSPPWLNDKGTWLMEPLKSIRALEGRYCYELDNGVVYPNIYSARLGETNIIWENAGHE